MFSSITKKPLWLSLLIALGIVAIVILIFFSSLRFFTRHGEEVEIPNVAGKQLDDAMSILKAEGFEVFIQDSIYRDTIKPHAVVKQFPDAEAKVKANRTVYLTINRAVPPDVVMPNLVGMSIRNAAIVIKQFGLKMGDTSYKPDFAKNSVLEQSVGGKGIKPGTKLPMGTAVSLVLGSGLSNIDMTVPDLFGLTFTDAQQLMQTSGVSFGAVVPSSDVKDRATAYIYRQNPERQTPDRRVNRIRPGQMIDVWLQAQPPVRDTGAIQRSSTPIENNY